MTYYLYVWCFIVHKLLSFNYSFATQEPCKNKTLECPTFCNCSLNEAVCIGEALTYIPQLPEVIELITLKNGNLSQLSNEAMSNLTFNRVTRLSFINNSIFHIGPKAFSHIEPLTQFALVDEPRLAVDDVIEAFSSMNVTFLQILTINSNEWSKLPDSFFQVFEPSRINSCSFYNNKLNSVNFSSFSSFKLLKKLDLSSNNIVKIYPGNLPNLKTLMINNNELKYLPSFCDPKNGASFLPNLHKLELDFNRIETLEVMKCFPRLMMLSLKDNSLRRIVSNTFFYLKWLRELDLSRVGRYLEYIDEGAFTSSTLEILKFRENNYHFERHSKMSLSKMFTNCKSLRYLDLSENFIYPGNEYLPPILEFLVNLTHLKLESTHLVVLPERAFAHLRNLNTLIIENNRLYGWNDMDLFGNITSLRKLSMQYNFLRIINETSFPRNVLGNLKEINLAVNGYNCICDLMWYVGWLKTTRIEVVKYPRHYYCTQPPTLNGVKLAKYNPTYNECHPMNPLFTVAIIVSSFGVIVVIAIVLIVRFHTVFKNYVYLMRVQHQKRKGYLPIENSDDYEYHAFVVYCDHDRTWVHDEFVGRIERENEFNLCVHHRNFEVGASISENIDSFLKRSWKVVVIMSNAFAKSEWCQWEVDIVQERRRKYGKDVIIPILLESISSRNMTSPLRTLMDSTPYIRYKKGLGEDLFWKLVKESLWKPVRSVPVSEL